MPKYKLHVRRNYFKNTVVEVEAENEEAVLDTYHDEAGPARQMIEYKLAENDYIFEQDFALKVTPVDTPSE